METIPATHMENVREILSTLLHIRCSLQTAPETAEPIEYRVQYHNGDWILWVGSPQCDTDHRGHWGAGTVDVGDSERDVTKTLINAVNEALDSAAQ
jgi:hypothetical protein